MFITWVQKRFAYSVSDGRQVPVPFKFLADIKIRVSLKVVSY